MKLVLYIHVSCRHTFQVKHQPHCAGTENKNWLTLEEMEKESLGKVTESMTMITITIWEILTGVKSLLVQFLEALVSTLTLAEEELADIQAGQVRHLLL